MPILDLQRQARELGRIRTGVQEPARTRTGFRPAKLDTFRITAASRDLVAAAAAVYGGEVAEWQSPNGKQWQVITESPVLDVIVPPGQVLDQWFEMWASGGCQRRCDGRTNVLNDTPCACPADVEERLELAKDGRACKATTRLWVVLWKLPDIGRWRLESHGYYAAVELGGAAEMLARATQQGQFIPATLRLDQRQRKTPGQPPKRFLVPVLEATNLYVGAMGLVDPAFGQLQGGEITALPAPAPMRQLGTGTPAIPSTPLPERSTFRAPAPHEAVDGNPTAEVLVEPAAGTLTAAGSQDRPDETSGEVQLAATAGRTSSSEASLIDRLQRSLDAWRGLNSPVPRETWAEQLGPILKPIPAEMRALVIREAFGLEPLRREDGAITSWPFESRHVQALLEVSGRMAAGSGPDAFTEAWNAAAEALL